MTLLEGLGSPPSPGPPNCWPFAVRSEGSKRTLYWAPPARTASTPFGLAVSVVLIAAGIGLLKLREWARKASIAYGIYGVVVSLVGTYIQFSYVMPILEELLETATSIEKISIVSAMGAIYFAMCWTILYPILVLIFMNRRVAKEAIAEAEAARTDTE